MDAALRVDPQPEAEEGSVTERIPLYPGGRHAWIAAGATIIVSLFALIVFGAVMVRYVVSPPPQALSAARSASYP